MYYTSNVDTQKANEYLTLCNKAEDAFYHIKRGKPDKYRTKNGYIAMAIGDKTGIFKSNFKAVLFQKGDEYVIYFFGTDVKSSRDLYTCGRMGTFGTPKQFEDAYEFVSKFLEDKPHLKDSLTVIGNSEGGAEAIYVKILQELKQAYTYNAYIPDIDPTPEQAQNIYNFRSPGDPISKMSGTIGEDFIVPLKDGFKPHKGPMKMIDYHRIDNMGDCTKALPVVEFKQKNPKFVNKYRHDQLSQEALAEIPNEIYDAVEKDVISSIFTRGITTENYDQYNNCVGFYNVSAYTRDDGTEVSGYTRRCGAKHSRF